MDELRALKLFLKVAEAGSFQRAATDAGLSAQAVGKSVAQLEAHLGVRLLNRTTRRCSLTQEGAALREQAALPIDALVRALADVGAASVQVSGVLRVCAAPSARQVIAEPLARFLDRHPRLRLDWAATNTLTHRVEGQVEVGFRSGREPQGEVVSRRLFPVQQVVCAAPMYLARFGVPRSLEDLRRHRCTAYRHPATGRTWPWERPDGSAALGSDTDWVAVVDDPEAELALVRAGLGIGLLDTVNAAVDLREGRLVQVLGDERFSELGFHLYYPSRKRLPQRVRAFVQFVVGPDGVRGTA